MLETESDPIAEPFAGAGLNPIIGLAREDLLGAVTLLLRETAGRPGRTFQLWSDMSNDALQILARKSDIAPTPGDKRFLDPTWTANPFYNMGMQYYFAATKRVRAWISELEVDELERARVSFVAGMIVDALAPTNAFATNPSAIKRSLETGGSSLLKGLRNVYDDIVNNDMIVSQVDKRPFTVGGNLAAQEGSVILRTEMLELIEYRPVTEEVHAVPLVVVPPQINKAYIFDLSPANSFVRYALEQGLRVYLVSWRNPGPEQRGWGLNDYVDELIAALDAVREIAGSDKVNVSAACSGGITTATLLSKLKSQDRDIVGAATLQVCVLDPKPGDTEVGALVSANGIELARKRSAEKGVLEGRSLSRVFAWLRPNDLVWNYAINNYLHGDDPPAFDILFWNNDSTNLSAALHSDFLKMYEENPFTAPGRHELAGHRVNLAEVDADLFILGGATDHITPWKACYRSTQLFGSKNIEFVLSHSGHIQAILNPPGNPKARFHRVEGALPPTAEEWAEQAQATPGSWWPHWSGWIKARSGGLTAAPTEAGSRAHPPIDAAPGRYVHG